MDFTKRFIANTYIKIILFVLVSSLAFGQEIHSKEKVSSKEKQEQSSEVKSTVGRANKNLSKQTSVKSKKKRKKRRKKRRKRKISRKKLEAYIKRGLEDGTLSLDRLNKLEAKYWANDLRYEPYVNKHPYMPHKWDYGLEVGGMEIKKDLYWLGGNLGYNVGTCVLTKSPSCQQYMDVLLGSSGRDGETNWYGVLSLRWQFVNFPNTFSPVARVFGGVMNRIADGTNKQFFIYGLGYGVTTYLHPKANLRLEARTGWGKDIGNFNQAFISIEFKVSRWLDFFAGKLEKVGVGTGRLFKKGVGTSGKVIKGTGRVIKKGAEGTGTLIKGTGSVLKKGVEGTGSVIQGTGNIIKKGAGAIVGSKNEETKAESEEKNSNKKSESLNEE